MRNWWMAAPLMGCQLGAFDDEVYWLRQVEDGAADRESIVEHNFLEARGINEPAPDGDGVAFTVERLGADEGFYAYVQRAADGIAFVHIADQVLIGSVVDGRLLADWSRFDEQERVVEGIDLFRTEGVDETNAFVGIELDDEGGGTLELSSERRLRFSETDVWDPATVGVFSSGIPAGAFLIPAPGSSLGSVTNSPDAVDCLRDPCQLSVVDRSVGSYALQVVPVAGGFEQFEALRGFESPDSATFL